VIVPLGRRDEPTEGLRHWFLRSDGRRRVHSQRRRQPRIAYPAAELDLHLLLRRSLHNFQQSNYSRLVDLLNDPARQSLGEYSRDEAWKILWRVCLRQPRLVLLGLRGLMMRGRSLDRPKV